MRYSENIEETIRLKLNLPILSYKVEHNDPENYSMQAMYEERGKRYYKYNPKLPLLGWRIILEGNVIWKSY